MTKNSSQIFIVVFIAILILVAAIPLLAGSDGVGFSERIAVENTTGTIVQVSNYPVNTGATIFTGTTPVTANFTLLNANLGLYNLTELSHPYQWTNNSQLTFNYEQQGTSGIARTILIGAFIIIVAIGIGWGYYKSQT